MEFNGELFLSERKPLMISSVSFGISEPNAPAISEKIAASTLNTVRNNLERSPISAVPLDRFARHLDWHSYPTHLDLARLVQQTGIANHFVAASSSIMKGVEGSKKKAPRGGEIRSTKFEIRNKHQGPEIQNPKRLPRLRDSVSVISASCFEFVSDFELRISGFRTSRLRISGFDTRACLRGGKTIEFHRLWGQNREHGRAVPIVLR
jgi:hypothetical protein